MRSIITPKQNYKDEQILNRPLGNGFDIYDVLMEVREHYSLRALEQANNVKNEAADLLGLPNRQTLANWLDKFKEGKIKMSIEIGDKFIIQNFRSWRDKNYLELNNLTFLFGANSSGKSFY